MFFFCKKDAQTMSSSEIKRICMQNVLTVKINPSESSNTPIY